MEEAEYVRYCKLRLCITIKDYYDFHVLFGLVNSSRNKNFFLYFYYELGNFEGGTWHSFLPFDLQLVYLVFSLPFV